MVFGACRGCGAVLGWVLGLWVGAGGKIGTVMAVISMVIPVISKLKCLHSR